MAQPERHGGLKDVDEAQNPLTPCERQVELAGSPLLVVKRALAKNPNLCNPAREVLGDELEKLLQAAGDDVRNTLE